MKLGVSSLFAIARGFKYLLKHLEPHLDSFEALEVLDEGATKLNEERLRKLKDLAKTYDLELSLHAPFIDVNPASLSPFMRKASLKHLSRSLARASKLECSVWVMHGGYYPHPKVRALAHRLSLASINKLAKLAEDLGVKVAIENDPAIEGCLLVKAEEARELVEEALGRRVGLCLDLGHANTAHEVEAFLQVAGDLVIHVHAHDNDAKRDLHLTPGEGSIDWRKVVDRITRLGFKGGIIVETEGEPWTGLMRLREWLTASEA